MQGDNGIHNIGGNTEGQVSLALTEVCGRTSLMASLRAQGMVGGVLQADQREKVGSAPGHLLPAAKNTHQITFSYVSIVKGLIRKLEAKIKNSPDPKFQYYL